MQLPLNSHSFNFTIYNSIVTQKYSRKFKLITNTDKNDIYTYMDRTKLKIKVKKK